MSEVEDIREFMREVRATEEADPHAALAGWRLADSKLREIPRPARLLARIALWLARRAAKRGLRRAWGRCYEGSHSRGG